MQPKWTKPCVISSLPNGNPMPGVYMIMKGSPLPRVGGTDPNGILYIGKGSNAYKRLDQFHYADHIASDLMRMRLPVACAVLGCKVAKEKDLYPVIGRLMATVAGPIKRKHLDEAERAVLMAYLLKYGELPPLNFSMRGRWKDAVSAADLGWAMRGIRRPK